jgi:hypothetical protein
VSRSEAHRIGDDCPGGHFADPGSDGSCCRAAQDTGGDQHAWNCEPTWRTKCADELVQLAQEVGLH